MRRVVVATAVVYSVAHFAATGIRQALANFRGDFLASFPAWKVAALTGRLDLYAGSLSNLWGPPPIWHYGPLLHLITAPLLALPTLHSAYVVWLFVSLVFVGIAAMFANRIVDDALLVFIVFCNFNPLYEALSQRAIELFELMLLFAAYVWLRRGRERASGLAIGAAAMAKFLPLIFLPWLVVTRRWLALAAALAVIVPTAIATQLILGWQHSGTVIQLRNGSFLDRETNQSLSGVAIRVLRWTHSDLSPSVVSVVLIVICIVLLSIVLLRRNNGVEDLEFGLLTTAMVLLPPHNENYYFVFLLLPYFVLYARVRTNWSWRAALLALSFVLVAVPIPLSIVQRLTGLEVFRIYLAAAIPFAGAALLVVVLVAEIGMSRALFTASSHVPGRDVHQPQRIHQQPG